MPPKARGLVRQNTSGQWYAVISAGTDPVTQRRRRFWYRADPNTKKAAEKLRTEKLHELDTKRHVEPSKQTLAEFLPVWLEAHASQVRANTLHNYESKIRNWVTPKLGHHQLQQITPQILQAFYQDLLDAGLTLGTVQQTHGMLVRVFGDANRWKQMMGNPAKEARAPKQSDGVPDARPRNRAWTRTELRAFLDVARKYRLFPVYYLLANTGMRPEEANGLRWDAVNLDRNLLIVAYVRTTAGKGIQEGPPKTKSSRRVIELDDSTVAVLREWQQTQRIEAAYAGDAWEETGFVFTNQTGQPFYPQYISQKFTKIIADDLDFPPRSTPRRLYDFRHTHATLLLEAGVDVKTVSARLGHSSVAFTLDTYAEVTASQQSAAARAMEGLLADD